MALIKNKLRHPNVMSESERLALPDPCRPFDELVIPAKRRIDLFSDSPMDVTTTTASVKVQSSANELSASFHPSNAKNSITKIKQSHAKVHQVAINDGIKFKQVIDIKKFIQEQQQQSQHEACKFRLPLSLLPRLVNEAGLSLLEGVMSDYPYFSLNYVQQVPISTGQTAFLPHSPRSENPNAMGVQHEQANLSNKSLDDIQTRLYLMGKMYHTMLCVFLLCQCKSRKTLNHQITLQQLTDAINSYVEAHHTELTFLTHQTDLVIEPSQVEFAILALGWQMSKHSSPSQRVTTISSQNPLTLH